MNEHEQFEMILKTINVWEFLQYIDELYENNKECGEQIMNGFYQKRHKWTAEYACKGGMLPHAQLKTTLSILLVTLCYARSTVTQEEWIEAGMKENSECYDICIDSNRPRNVETIIRTIRNAAAHCFDNKDRIVFPDGKILSFQTQGKISSSDGASSREYDSRVEFNTADGFIKFVSDYLSAIRKIIKKQL